ncbi:hypothetical protein KEM52_000880, partial [Ascosphaera acerosa]
MVVEVYAIHRTIRFLNDPNKDVYTATQELLERFLDEIKKISAVKRGIALKRADRETGSTATRRSELSGGATGGNDDDDGGGDGGDGGDGDGYGDGASHLSASDPEDTDSEETHVSGDWIPGEDVEVDHAKILDILVEFVDAGYEEEIQLTALRWLDSFFDIDPEEFLQFIPRLLGKVLPALASTSSHKVRDAASSVNSSLMQYIVSFPNDALHFLPLATTTAAASTAPVAPAEEAGKPLPPPPPRSHPVNAGGASNREAEDQRRPSAHTTVPPKHMPPTSTSADAAKRQQQQQQQPSDEGRGDAPMPVPDGTGSTTGAPTNPSISRAPTSSSAFSNVLDYGGAVRALTLQFSNENEDTRVAALTWLLMLHRKAPKRILTSDDGTFPALLRTLSDSSEAVVTRDLQLLSQISRNSEDKYFASFMVELLRLFSTDRYLLEKRGNLIIRQLCTSLSPERIYKTLADCLEKEEDMEFASIMIQNLNNNLITAPELADLRKRLRNLESKQEGQAFFVTLFRSWCHNAVSAFSLCLLAQAAELDVSVNMLIQIDKLVQLLESPVFTYLRLQLLEPDRYPYLYKCLYGLLMLLPQSSAFAALKNRLNSVSNIGLLQMNSRTGGSSAAPSYERPTAARLGKVRENEAITIRWTDLLDKFRGTQERWRRFRDRPAAFHAATGTGPGLGVGAGAYGANVADPSTLDPLGLAASSAAAQGLPPFPPEPI